MHYRLLQYHVNLHAKYKKPVISVVLYPFEENISLPPYEEMSVEEALLTWKYWALGLYNLEADHFRRKQAFCMYSLLPAMKGAHADMLIQALHDLKLRYPTEAMKHHLDRFWKMLQKSITITQEDKMRVEEELKMQYDWFIDTVPEVIERVNRSKAEGKVEGKAEGLVEGEERGATKGELRALRRMALRLVQTRFPALLSFAQVQVNAALTQPAQLDKLVLDLAQARDDVTAIRLLTINEQTA